MDIYIYSILYTIYIVDIYKKHMPVYAHNTLSIMKYIKNAFNKHIL